MKFYNYGFINTINMTISRNILYIISLYVVAFFYIILIIGFTLRYSKQRHVEESNTQITYEEHWRNLSRNHILKLSELGKILFLDKIPPTPKPTIFKILIWNDVTRIENRHIKRFGKKRYNPWEKCVVNNCKIMTNRTQLDKADAVLFPIQTLKSNKDFPHHRSPNQIWIMLTDESPYHPFMNKPPSFLSTFNGFFNWTMTYRMDSDVPVPYGRALKKVAFSETNIIIPTANSSKKVHVVNLSSNCGSNSHRWEYIKELKKHIPVDIIGKCGKNLCPGHFHKPCDAIQNYTFYLAFENSHCTDYLTEKIWWNAYHNNLIPIVLGPSLENCKKLLPPKSYLHVDEFSSPASLAKYLNYLINSPKDFHLFFEWKHNYTILNEHGYFQSQSFHFCRICEALNFNSNNTKVYDRLDQFWNAQTDCYK